MTARRELLTFVAGAATAGAALPVAALAGQDRGARGALPDLDAALIAACDEHVKRMAAYNAEPEDNGSLFDAMTETHDFITEAEPQSMAGLVAMARAIEAENVDPGDFTSSGTEWAWTVAMGLLRIADAGLIA